MITFHFAALIRASKAQLDPLMTDSHEKNLPSDANHSGTEGASPGNPILKNVLAVVCGIVVGNIVNMGLITMSPRVIAPPAGVDPAHMESLKENIGRFGPQHFVMPFLAHALGTLAGAFVAAKLAASRQLGIALGIGAVFLLGGIAMAVMLPAPMWFEACDIIVAYLPMGWLGWKLAGHRRLVV